MARAKKTDRAEARRRYRAETATTDDGATDEGDAAPASAARSTRAATTAYSTPSGRVGIGTAFRTAFHPVNIREDLAALPWLLRSRAFLIPLAVTVASSTLVTVTGGRDVITSLPVRLLRPDPADRRRVHRRASSPRGRAGCSGSSSSFIAAFGYMVFILSVTTGTPDEAVARQALPRHSCASPILGALFAAGAAWYRRFLQLSNPNRGAPRPRPKSSADGRVADQRHPEGARQALVAAAQPRRRIPA